MAGRKRRSLLAKGGNEGEEEREEAASAAPSDEPEAESSAPDPFAVAEEPEADPFAVAEEPAPEPEPAASAGPPPAAEPPRAEPGFQRPPPMPSEPVFASFGDLPDDEDPFAAVAVKENRNAAGRTYTDAGKRHDDTTDDAWSGSAWGKGQDSLPPGWGGGTPEPAQPRKEDAGGPEPMRKIQPGYFDGEEPPTEEHPAPAYEDHSHAYSAPMNVPEPPPIPGLFDRFTPPPVPRKTFSSGPTAEDRPKYQATPHPAPSRPEPTGAAFKPAPRAADDDDDDDEEDAKGGGIPVMYLMAGGVAVLGAIMLGVILVVMSSMSGDPPKPTGPPPKPPEIVKTAPPPPPVEVTDTDAGTAAATTDAGATTPPVEAAAGSATAAPVPKTTTPKTTPVKPKGGTKASTSTDAAKKGTLKIRSNRRVLVKVNGQPRDYSPLDLPLAPGTYSISAALPGKPESEQVVEVTLKAGASEPVNFSF